MHETKYYKTAPPGNRTRGTRLGTWYVTTTPAALQFRETVIWGSYCSKKIWRIGVSIPVPRACKARTLPIELIPLTQFTTQIASQSILTRLLFENEKVENPGFDPGASSLLTTHSTNWANPPSAILCTDMLLICAALWSRGKNWRMRVSIPLPRRCERRTLPIELIPQYDKCYTDVYNIDYIQMQTNAHLQSTYIQCVSFRIVV